MPKIFSGREVIKILSKNFGHGTLRGILDLAEIDLEEFLRQK